MKKTICLAWSALLLDVIAFILSSIWLCSTTSIIATLILAIFIYIFAYDAYQASVYLMNQYKK